MCKTECNIECDEECNAKCNSVGPTWTYNKLVEKPAGIESIGTSTHLYYNEEQQKRLNVDKYGISLDTFDEHKDYDADEEDENEEEHKSYEVRGNIEKKNKGIFNSIYKFFFWR